MPKVNAKKKSLSNVKYVSVIDFYKQLDEIDSLDDKLKFTTRYILNHDMEYGHDYPFTGLVNLARQRIAEAASLNVGKKENKAVSMFLGNPAGYLKGEANKLADEINKKEATEQFEKDLKDNCEKIAKRMDEQFNNEIFDIDTRSAYIGVRSKLEANFGGRKQLDEVIEGTKDNWFSRLISSSSPQWAALETAYDTFNNPNMNGFCDLEHLNRNAVGYMKHKFPKWKEGEDIPMDKYAKLNKTERAKVNFTIAVLNAVKEQSKVEENFHSLVDESKAKDIKYEDIPVDKEELGDLDLNQSSFQEDLRLQTSFDSDLIDDSIEESDDYRLLKDDDELESESLISDDRSV